MLKISTILLLILILFTITGCQLEPVELQASTDSYDVELGLDAASLGYRTAIISINPREGSNKIVENVVLNTGMYEMRMGMPSFEATRIDSGTYNITDETLFTMTGEWFITVDISDGEGTEIAEFNLEVVQ